MHRRSLGYVDRGVLVGAVTVCALSIPETADLLTFSLSHVRSGSDGTLFNRGEKKSVSESTACRTLKQMD